MMKACDTRVLQKGALHFLNDSVPLGLIPHPPKVASKLLAPFSGVMPWCLLIAGCLNCTQPLLENVIRKITAFFYFWKPGHVDLKPQVFIFPVIRQSLLCHVFKVRKW